MSDDENSMAARTGHPKAAAQSLREAMRAAVKALRSARYAEKVAAAANELHRKGGQWLEAYIEREAVAPVGW